MEGAPQFNSRDRGQAKAAEHAEVREQLLGKFNKDLVEVEATIMDLRYKIDQIAADALGKSEAEQDAATKKIGSYRRELQDLERDKERLEATIKVTPLN